MLKKKQVQQFYAKINKSGINQSKIARKFQCSNGKLNRILNLETSCRKVERSLLDWLYDREEN